MAQLEKFAQPGDPDLDLDIDAVVITNVVRDGNEVMVSMEGGFGEWIGEDDDEMQDVDNVSEVLITMLYPHAREGFVEKLVEILDDWRARNVPLRVVAAPGRMTSLIEDAQHWLPLARKWPPPVGSPEPGAAP